MATGPNETVRTITDAAEVKAVAISPDNRRLASVGYEHCAYVKLWDVTTGESV